MSGMEAAAALAGLGAVLAFVQYPGGQGWYFLTAPLVLKLLVVAVLS